MSVQSEKVDSLISFKESIAAGNYLKGARKLVAEDRSKILDGSGIVREEMKPRLRALRLKNIVKDSAQAILHAAAKLLFSDIRSGNWQFVLNDMHPSTRSYFIAKNGKIKEGARRRLSEIDTSAWQASSLRKGKLVGATGMLVDAEKERISQPDGAIKSGFKKKLKTLDRKDWDSLFSYHGKLSGVLDLMDEPNPAGIP